MSAKLIIDWSKLNAADPSGIRCSYKHHPENRGFDVVLERVRFGLICRRCESAPCVAACPHGALEKAPTGPNGDKVLRRANMLCTGCGTCAMACPFGTVSDDLMVFASSVCDLCKDRLGSGEKPLCVRTSPDGVVGYGRTRTGDGAVEVLEGVVVKNFEDSLWKPALREGQGGKE